MKLLTPEEKKHLACVIALKLCKNSLCFECPLSRLRERYNEMFPTCGMLLLEALRDNEPVEPVPVPETETTTPTCPKTEQAPAKSALPAWCKVGAWVFFCVNGKDILGRVTDCDTASVCADIRAGGSFVNYSVRLSDTRPVRFRPYSFEEAGKLAGKYVECEYGDADSTYKALEIVNYVILTPGGTVEINDKTFREWQCLNATIDGVPFGVPEVDTEAEKEARNESNA